MDAERIDRTELSMDEVNHPVVDRESFDDRSFTIFNPNSTEGLSSMWFGETNCNFLPLVMQETSYRELLSKYWIGKLLHVDSI